MSIQIVDDLFILLIYSSLYWNKGMSNYGTSFIVRSRTACSNESHDDLLACTRGNMASSAEDIRSSCILLDLDVIIFLLHSKIS